MYDDRLNSSHYLQLGYTHTFKYICMCIYNPTSTTCQHLLTIVIVLSLLYYSWKIRHVTFLALDDSRCLLIGAGVTVMLTLGVCVIHLLFPNDATALALVMSSFLWFGTTALIVNTFLPKVSGFTPHTVPLTINTLYFHLSIQ